MDDQDTPRNQPAVSREGSVEVKNEDGQVKSKKKTTTPRRTVCDHCRRRRIRCDGNYPCEQCNNAALSCKRDHVPKKRGPKRGHGRVINELRARDGQPQQPRDPDLGGSPTEYVRHRLLSVCPPLSFDSLDFGFGDLGDTSLSSNPPSATASPPPFTWSNPTSATLPPEPSSIFSSDELRPRSRDYLHMIPQCVELYYEHIYPIMPLLYMPAIRETISRPMSSEEKNLIYALCALTSMHMSGKSIDAPGPPSWEVVGRFFLDECISTRQSYDYLEDLSLSAVISSFYLSTSFFEINQSRKSWYYLREAVTNAQDLGLHDDSTYLGLPPEEVLCRQRVFWILFVTERSFAILRNKPITFKRTPSLPTTRHSYEAPDIHAGFLQLVSSYTPLDESFVTAWNEGSDPHISATTYLALQNLLALPPAFLRPRTSASSLLSYSSSESASEPTDIQKADLLITQQWLRLIVWQSSMRQGLLTWTNPGDPSSPTSVAGNDSMCFSYPLAVARDTASILASLPSKAVEVHGMGIMEKIFEIGSWFVNVLGACDSVGFSTQMDFTTGDLGLLGVGRKGAALDPIEFFVRTLSASPNSRTQFAEKLLTAAGENPGSMRMALSPALSSMDSGIIGSTDSNWSHNGSGVVEITDEGDETAMVDLDGAAFETLPGYETLGLGLMTDDMTSNRPGLHVSHSAPNLANFMNMSSAGTDLVAGMGVPSWGGSDSGQGQDGRFTDLGDGVLSHDMATGTGGAEREEVSPFSEGGERTEAGRYHNGLVDVW